MLSKLIATFAVMSVLAVPSLAADWGYDAYSSYEPGYFNTLESDLYNDNDDWFYDNYTVSGDAQQQEEDSGVFDNSYGWEADENLFADE